MSLGTRRKGSFFGDVVLYYYLKSKMGRLGGEESTGGCEKRNKITTLKRFLNLKKWKKNTKISKYIKQRDGGELTDFSFSANFKA